MLEPQGPQQYVISLHFNLFTVSSADPAPILNHKPAFPALTFLLVQCLMKIVKFQDPLPITSFLHPPPPTLNPYSTPYLQTHIPGICEFKSFAVPSLPSNIVT